MLKLYHGKSSVCSIKARIGLAEKRLDWESCLIDLSKGEQFTPEYLKLNPNAVVPTLDHDGFIVIESSVILQYLDLLNDRNRLMPADIRAQTRARLWLLRTLDMHAAINTMTFATAGREQILAGKTPEEIEHSIKKMPNPRAAAKRRDLIKHGISSSHLDGDFFTLQRMFEDMQTALDQAGWLAGDTYSLADTAVIAYVDRLDRLGLSGFWEERYPCVSSWLEASRARPSYGRAVEAFIGRDEAKRTRDLGGSFWPEIKQKWDRFRRLK
ncbi:MAG: glutathione S-transferase family protein [Desulfofustis sp.]|jgi:glutathione S-transferase|nr:glutathione S-transferase family protein [Desulfofustis sp.]